ncbi:MAG: helix-turn-helix transcriptional regulator [Clostridia bacterium]|nr:helix-turn-helix transcriptional regulator [Clostridia bacterium]
MDCRKNLMKTFRQIVLRTRFECGLTQEQMAEKMDICPRTYADLERGKSLCNTDTFFKFLVCCSVDPEADEKTMENAVRDSFKDKF